MNTRQQWPRRTVIPSRKDQSPTRREKLDALRRNLLLGTLEGIRGGCYGCPGRSTLSESQPAAHRIRLRDFDFAALQRRREMDARGQVSLGDRIELHAVGHRVLVVR